MYQVEVRANNKLIGQTKMIEMPQVGGAVFLKGGLYVIESYTYTHTGVCDLVCRQAGKAVCTK